MRVPSGTATGSRRLVCPFCESGELVSLGLGVSRCDSCGLPLLGSALHTQRDVVGLPDALGALNFGYNVAFVVGAGCVVLGALIAATMLLRSPKDASPQ